MRWMGESLRTAALHQGSSESMRNEVVAERVDKGLTLSREMLKGIGSDRHGERA